MAERIGVVRDSGFHHLAFPAWSNWFYSTLLVVKIITFQRTGSTGSTCVHYTPHAVGELLPQEYGEVATQAVCTMTNSLSKASLGIKRHVADITFRGVAERCCMARSG